MTINEPPAIAIDQAEISRGFIFDNLAPLLPGVGISQKVGYQTAKFEKVTLRSIQTASDDHAKLVSCLVGKWLTLLGFAQRAVWVRGPPASFRRGDGYLPPGSCNPHDEGQALSPWAQVICHVGNWSLSPGSLSPPGFLTKAVWLVRGPLPEDGGCGGLGAGDHAGRGAEAVPPHPECPRGSGPGRGRAAERTGPNQAGAAGQRVGFLSPTSEGR